MDLNERVSYYKKMYESEDTSSTLPKVAKPSTSPKKKVAKAPVAKKPTSGPKKKKTPPVQHKVAHQ